MSEQSKHGKRRNGKVLTDLQAGMLEGLVAGKSDVTAYRDAGGTGLNPKSVHCVKRAIQEKLPDIMYRIGLTDEKLVREHLMPALDACETKFFQKDGVVTDERQVPAWEPRLKALDMAFNLLGSYAARPGTRVELPADGEIEVVVRRVE